MNVDRDQATKQLKAGYNIITVPDRHSYYNADFIIQTTGRLRRRPGHLFNTRTYYHAPEDLILAKLRMVKATRPRERSLKDREDIRAILRNTKVDKRRITSQARKETTLAIFTDIGSTLQAT